MISGFESVDLKVKFLLGDVRLNIIRILFQGCARTLAVRAASWRRVRGMCWAAKGGGRLSFMSSGLTTGSSSFLHDMHVVKKTHQNTRNCLDNRVAWVIVAGIGIWDQGRESQTRKWARLSFADERQPLLSATYSYSR